MKSISLGRFLDADFEFHSPRAVGEIDFWAYGVQTGQSEVQKTPRWSPKGSDVVLDGPNVDPKLPKAARRASGMAWGPRSKCLSQDF